MNTAVFLASSEFLLLVAMQHLVKGRVIVVFPPDYFIFYPEEGYRPCFTTLIPKTFGSLPTTKIRMQ